MKIEQWEIERVKPYDKNPRRNDKAVEAVAKSIKEFGFRQPIVVDAGGVIVVGHTRYKAALKLGLKTVPVHVAADLTPQQARAYRLADNRTAETAEWDIDFLPIETNGSRNRSFLSTQRIPVALLRKRVGYWIPTPPPTGGGWPEGPGEGGFWDRTRKPNAAQEDSGIKHMIARARQLRRESSFPERLLWSRLRNGRWGG